MSVYITVNSIDCVTLCTNAGSYTYFYDGKPIFCLSDKLLVKQNNSIHEFLSETVNEDVEDMDEFDFRIDTTDENTKVFLEFCGDEVYGMKIQKGGNFTLGISLSYDDVMTLFTI